MFLTLFICSKNFPLFCFAVNDDPWSSVMFCLLYHIPEVYALNKLEKILLLIGLVLLSVLLRTIFEPSFLGIYLDKLSLYLLALVLGLKFTILGAVLIVICYALVLNDIIGIFRLPTTFYSQLWWED